VGAANEPIALAECRLETDIKSILIGTKANACITIDRASDRFDRDGNLLSGRNDRVAKRIASTRAADDLGMSDHKNLVSPFAISRRREIECKTEIWLGRLNPKGEPAFKDTDLIVTKCRNDALPVSR
jgi:hypothetical protein